MKLLAPCMDLNTCINQIEAGADELYLGADSGTFKNFTFNGRGKYNILGSKICPDFDELEKIVQYAHSKNVSILFAANTPFIADNLNGDNTFEQMFLDYLQKGISAGIDYIILGEIGAILLALKNNITTPIIAGSFLETINYYQALFLKELGVKRVVASYQTSIDDLEALTSIKDMETEVFAHYGCSFYDGYCNLKHSFGETNLDIGTPCQHKYKLQINQEEYVEGFLLNASLICSLCSLPMLKDMGVNSVKLVGRDMNFEQNIHITSVYSRLIKLINSKAFSIDEFHEEREKLLPARWKTYLCDKNKCKYLDNIITRQF